MILCKVTNSKHTHGRARLNETLIDHVGKLEAAKNSGTMYDVEMPTNDQLFLSGNLSADSLLPI